MNLKTIKLNKNEIESLEGLQSQAFPELEVLEIGANYLSTCRALRKMHAPKLSILILANNQIVNSMELTEMESTSLTRLFMTNFSGKEQVNDPRNMAKLQSGKMESLGLWSEKRIKLGSFISCYLKKHKNIHMDIWFKMLNGFT